MIIVVYHAYLTGKWKELVVEQINRLVASGLYDRADQIWMTVNKNGNSEEEVKQLLSKFKKINIEFCEFNNAEYPGIKKVKELGKIADAKILYFHTKGVSNNWKTCQGREYSHEKTANVSLWRECLEYFLIDGWNDCVKLLNDNDTVGVTCNGGWYWGNFWWATSKHITKTEEVGLWDRWSYEAWLNKNVQSSKNFEFFHFEFDPYLSPLLPEYYKPELYANTLKSYKEQKITISKAVYGTPPYEIDEGYDTSPPDVVNDVTQIVTKLIKKDNCQKIDFSVNNDTMEGDPIWGQRKFLTIEFFPEEYPDKIFKIAAREGSNIFFKF
jgi:hypothetical protein